jgi:hypothetical protein
MRAYPTFPQIPRFLRKGITFFLSFSQIPESFQSLIQPFRHVPATLPTILYSFLGSSGEKRVIRVLEPPERSGRKEHADYREIDIQQIDFDGNGVIIYQFGHVRLYTFKYLIFLKFCHLLK